jgi:AraC family transcriptional regulator of arabinose operon
MDNPAISISERPQAERIVHLSQAERIIQKLALAQSNNDRQTDPEVAPLFPGFRFDTRLVSGITPIERDGPLDTYIDRPKGMRGWIINLTVKGSGSVSDGKDTWVVEKGDAVLFPPGVLHYYGRQPDAECWWHRWIYFHPRTFWHNWLSWHDRRQGLFFQSKLDTDLANEIERSFNEVTHWSSFADMLSMELAMNLLERILMLCAKHDQSGLVREDEFDERLLVACKYIADHLHQPLRIQDVARQACLSPSRLAHLFSEKLGKSILRWREEQRMQFACQLLMISNTPIKHIASQVGYDDPLYFSRVFRKYTDISPKAFRRRYEGS